MKTVKQMIDELKEYPEDALCYAYEGEVLGIIIIKRIDGELKDLGHIEANDYDLDKL